MPSRSSHLGEIVALAFGPDGRLYVADRTAGQVLIYDVAGEKTSLVRTFGQPAKPGDRAADHFFQLRGVAVDPKGFMVTIQTEPAGGARVARWTPEGKLAWEHFGCEFVSLGNYGVDDPETFYSMTFHRYHLADHAAGRWDYTGCMVSEKPAYQSDPHGVPRLLKLGDNKFWFMPTGDGVQVYRVTEQGMRLAAILGSSSPDVSGNPRGSNAGQWSWSDPKNSGKLVQADVQWFKKPGQGRHAVFGIDVDSHGDVWFGELNTHAIWTVPMAGLNSAGNPTYDWSKAREAVPKDTSPLGISSEHGAAGRRWIDLCDRLVEALALAERQSILDGRHDAGAIRCARRTPVGRAAAGSVGRNGYDSWR